MQSNTVSARFDLSLVLHRHYLAKAMRFTKDESADGNRRVWNALVSAARSVLLVARQARKPR